MNVTVSREDLVRELSVAEQASSRKPTIPVLNNVLLSSDGAQLSMSATDFEIWMMSSCPCTGIEGSATVNAAKLLEMARAIPAGSTIRLQLDGKFVLFEGASFRAKLQTIPVGEFPIRPVTPEKFQALSRVGLRDCLMRSRYATREDQRYALNAVLFSLKESVAEFVATDSHRLAFASMAVKDADPSDALLPKRTVDALVSALDSDMETVEYAKSDNHLFFRMGARLMVSRVIEGKFPAWSRIMPRTKREGACMVRVSRDLFLGAVRRVAMVSDQKLSTVSVTLSSNRLLLEAMSAEFGEGTEELVISDGPQQSIVLKVNSAYIVDALSVCASEDLDLEILSDATPVVFRDSGESTSGIGVVMPVRL